MNIRTKLASVVFSILLAQAVLSAQPDWSLNVQVDLGTDIGQNYGTLFELVDASGTAIAGAGYVGSYNTQSRSDRRALQFFVKAAQTPDLELQRLPRPTTDAGTYLYDSQGKLYSKSRGGNDRQLRQWQPDSNSWIDDNHTPPFATDVADGLLSSNQHGAYYNGNAILELKPTEGIFAERYYANGQLVFRRHDQNANPPVNQLIAIPWNSDQAQTLNLQDGLSVDMGTPREFVYAFGQIQDQIVAATNTGGLYVFDGAAWKTVLEPDTTVSFQIYTIINYGNRLLMGQYPTGELFSYDGQNLQHLPDWPPAVAGVQKRAREAQTLTIFGGDLYAGVWPWGEVWKYADSATGWKFSQRMFTHPELTDETTHPYENQTKKLGSVLNRWGQRVTSMVPIGNSMFISTSSKGGNAYEPKFTFLADDKWKEYGAVYQVTQPGSLVVATTWTKEPTNFQFQIKKGKLSVLQDGKLLGSAPVPEKLKGELTTANLQLRQGTFGPYLGKSITAPK